MKEHISHNWQMKWHDSLIDRWKDALHTSDKWKDTLHAIDWWKDALHTVDRYTLQAIDRRKSTLHTSDLLKNWQTKGDTSDN